MAQSKARFIAANFSANGRPKNVTGATGSGGGGGVDSASTLALVGFEGDVFRINNDNVSANNTIDSADRAMSAGPVSIDSGVTITVNGDWSVV